MFSARSNSSGERIIADGRKAVVTQWQAPGVAHDLGLYVRALFDPVVQHAHPLIAPSPSMRRPVDVKAHFLFLLSVSVFLFSQAASVAILPSALFGERSSLGASWVFSLQ
jgi:hypothetical protein